MAHPVRGLARNSEIMGPNPGGSDDCHKGCPYTVM